MSKPDKPDPDTAAIIETAVLRAGWRNFARQIAPNATLDEVERQVALGLRIDAMNRERLAMRAKWAEEERRRQAEEATTKVDEERGF